jgi:hypothetical protein
MRFLGNGYWPSDNKFLIKWGKEDFGGLESWRRSGQELFNGQVTGLQAEPGWSMAGNVNGSKKMALSLDFRLTADAPWVRKGVNLSELFGIDLGQQDFYGNPLHKNESPAIGASQP